MPHDNRLRDHIHMSTTLGSAPENAPNITWVVTDRLPVPMMFLSLKRAKNGTLRRHVLKSGGQEVQLENLKYTVRVAETDTQTIEERAAQLKALNGKFVYVCDLFHAPDGQDHTADVRSMVLAFVGEFPTVGPGLPFFDVDISLEDASL